MTLERELVYSDSTTRVFEVRDEEGNYLGTEVEDDDSPSAIGALGAYEPIASVSSRKPIPVIAHGDFTRKQTVFLAGVVTFVSSIAAQVIGQFFL